VEGTLLTTPTASKRMNSNSLFRVGRSIDTAGVEAVVVGGCVGTADAESRTFSKIAARDMADDWI